VIAVGGKTGTGDQRFDVYGAGHRLIESRYVNRSATFVFNIGERFFGSMTAYVHGPQSANYDFTSALPVQLLVTLAPSLMPMIESSDTVMVPGVHVERPGVPAAAGPSDAVATDTEHARRCRRRRGSRRSASGRSRPRLLPRKRLRSRRRKRQAGSGETRGQARGRGAAQAGRGRRASEAGAEAASGQAAGESAGRAAQAARRRRRAAEGDRHVRSRRPWKKCCSERRHAASRMKRPASCAISAWSRCATCWSPRRRPSCWCWRPAWSPTSWSIRRRRAGHPGHRPGKQRLRRIRPQVRGHPGARRHRVTLQRSLGSADNLQRLVDGQADIAFVQSGSTSQDEAERRGLVSLGSLFTEPVWLFLREPAKGQARLNSLTQLKGLRINLGPEGTGVPKLFRQVLAVNGVEPQAS
jgi:hypothetical protein